MQLNVVILTKDGINNNFEQCKKNYFIKFAGYIPYVIWNVKMLFWIDLLPFGVIAS